MKKLFFCNVETVITRRSLRRDKMPSVRKAAARLPVCDLVSATDRRPICDLVSATKPSLEFS